VRSLGLHASRHLPQHPIVDRTEELVSLGQGVSIVPEMAARLDRVGKVVYRNLAGTKASRTPAMVWHKRRYQRPLVESLVQAIRVETRRKTQNS